MFISIIIPVYNVEAYIETCVDSVLAQDFTDCEILLVNDGSTDNSGTICDRYAAQHDRVRVIHQENGGLSDARNVGLRAATGDYVLFVDSDDYIGAGSLAGVAAAAGYPQGAADVVFLEACKVFPNRSTVSLGEGYIAARINDRPKDEVMAHLASLPKYPGSACTKLICRQLIVDNDLYFEKGLLSEDIDWTLALLQKATRFSYCDAPYYYYRQGRTGSITNTVGIKHVRDMLYIIDKWASRSLGRPYQQEFNAFMAYEYMILLLNYGSLARRDRAALHGDVKRLAWVLSYARAKKARLTAACCRLLGVELTARLLRICR